MATIRARRLPLPSSVVFPKLTHYLFRYPAKFHPPVARSLIDRYTSPGDIILDPFCGSGSLLIEAAISGRRSVGTDIDPVAVFVSKVKTHRYRIESLRSSASSLSEELRPLARAPDEYEKLKFQDWDEASCEDLLRREELEIPSIPNAPHWFRRYVLVDLARILRVIGRIDIPESHRDFFRLCFASIIRNVSNADPVPVSGLEVTAHMKLLDAAGRRINVFEAFDAMTLRALNAADEYSSMTAPGSEVRVFQADAMSLPSRLTHEVDAVITSPPYHNAVDYYRRHQLEMFWLGMTRTQEERLQLRSNYIGRAGVAISDRLLREEPISTPLAKRWFTRMEQVSPQRARSFRHYTIAMGNVFGELARVLKPGAPTVFVVGHSSWNGSTIPTRDLFAELAQPQFVVKEQLWYPVKNRYMSYSRRNGASIDREYVLVLERAPDE